MGAAIAVTDLFISTPPPLPKVSGICYDFACGVSVGRLFLLEVAPFQGYRVADKSLRRSTPTERIRIRLRDRLGFRLAVFYTVLIVSVFSAAAWFSFYTAQKALDEELARKLTGIAQMVSRSLETRTVLAFRPGDEDSLRYRQWVRHLLEVKESMGVRDIFVFDKDHRVLLDVDGEIAIGREYRLLAIDSVEIQRIWTGEPSASTLYRGSDGSYYKSGYAPLFGPGNQVSAGVGVEAGAGFLSLLRTLREQMFFTALIGILVTVTLSLLFSRSLIFPIRRLVGVMGRVSESGTFETLPLERKDEIGYLGQRFNEMVETLAEKDQALRTLYTAEKERAEIVHRISAGLAHEIRNPLGALTGYAELLERRLTAPSGGSGSVPDENIRRLLEGMEEEVRILNKILTDFLTFAREPRHQMEKVEIPPLLHRVVDAAIPSGPAAGPGIHVEYRLEEGLPEIQADPLSLRKAFLNILLNAVQAMPKGGRLEIGGRPSLSSTDGTGGIEMTFSDTGVGIPVEDRDRIFHPFFTTRDEGTGLGLAISRKIIEEHGGAITLSSRVGLGTTFRIWLPVLPRVPETN